MSTDYIPNMMGLEVEKAMEEQMKVPGAKEMVDALSKSMVKAKDEQALKNIIEASNNLTDLKKAQKDFVDTHKTEINDDDLTLFPKPRSGCNHCYGRGNEGWDHITKEIRLCRCIINKFGRKDVDFMTVSELREVLGYAKKLFNIKEIDNEISSEVIQKTNQEISTEGIRN
jgi:hypothetical protein